MGMQFCLETSCGKAYLKRKALKEDNKMGVYEPDQITDTVNYYWAGGETCNKAQSLKTVIKVKKSVNYLGRIGNGKKFDPESFETQYKLVDMMGSEKVSKGGLETMVTAMMV